MSASEYCLLRQCDRKAVCNRKIPLIIDLDRITDVRNFEQIAGQLKVQAWCYRHSWKGSAQINADALKDIAEPLNHLPIARVKTYSTLPADDLPKIWLDSNWNYLRRQEKSIVRSWFFSSRVAMIMGRRGWNYHELIRHHGWSGKNPNGWPHLKAINCSVFCRSRNLWTQSGSEKNNNWIWTGRD